MSTRGGRKGDGERPASAQWSLSLPPGAYRVPVRAPPECSTMVHLRGELPPGALFFGVVTTRPLGLWTVQAFASHITKSVVAREGPRQVEVPGSSSAVRRDGIIDFEDEPSEEDVWRITVIVAEAAGELVTLSLRTRPEDAVAEAVEEVVASFAVAPAA